MTTQKPSGDGRNGNGEGSVTEVRQLPSGEKVFAWAIRALLPTGERRRLKGTYQGRSIQEARQAMWEAKRAAERGERAERGRDLTVGDLLDEWMRKERAFQGVSPRTLQLQRDLVRLHIRPRIGSWKVAALTPGLIDDFYTALLTTTTLERSRQQIHGVLRQAVAYALKRRYLTSSPLQGVGIPRRQERRKVSGTKVKAWTPAQAGLLEQAALAEGDLLGLSIAFVLRTGLRRGELFGLRWQDVNLADDTVRIEQVVAAYGKDGRTVTEPKNASSRRTIPVSTAARVMLLRAQELQAEGFPDGPAPEYVFSTLGGGMQHPRNLNRKLAMLTTRLGLPRLSVHALRHTMVSLAAHQGYPIKQISAMIGHKNTLVTQTIYWHLWPEHQTAIDLDFG